VLLAQAHADCQQEEDFELQVMMRSDALHLRTILENACRDIVSLNSRENTIASHRMNAEILKHLAPYSGYSFL
jgi:hypothetical protein